MQKTFSDYVMNYAYHLQKSHCKKCNDSGWVCEDHPDIAWKEGGGCCGGAGMMCACNIGSQARRVLDIFKKSDDIPREFDLTFRKNFRKILA